MIGLRVAIGATRGQILYMILAQADTGGDRGAGGGTEGDADRSAEIASSGMRMADL